MEKRLSNIAHPDLTFDDRTRDCVAAVSRNSSKSWRPSWLSSRSASTRSRGSSRYTVSSIDSRSTSVSARHPDPQNTYQLPINTSDPAREDESSAKKEEYTSPSMVFQFEDEAFEFPIPAVMANFVKKTPETLPAHEFNQSSHPPHVSSRQARGPPRARSATAMSTSGRTDSSQSTGNSSRKERNPLAEIEMASREQYGYWRASLTSRIPPAAAMCGSSILTARISSRRARNISTTDGDAVEDAYAFCNALDGSHTPAEALHVLQERRSSIQVIVIALQASIEAAQLPMIPVKVAASLYGKIIEGKSQPKKREARFSSISKLLRKIPQETLVVLMFLLSTAQRLQVKGITIDEREPALFLLRCMFPSSLALSPDQFAADKVSRLLAVHFDEIPGDMPLVLEGVNYRFAAGKKVNLLSLMDKSSARAQRESQKPGPRGVREIEGAEDKQIQW